MGRKNCGAARGDRKPCAREGGLDLGVAEHRKGRVSPSTPFFSPKSGPDTALTLRRVG